MTQVLFAFKHPSGEPLAGATFTVRLQRSGFIFESDGVVVPETLTFVTGADGTILAELEPSSTPYLMVVLETGTSDDEDDCCAGSKAIRYKFYVPDSDSVVRAQDLYLAPVPNSEPWDEEALQLITDAKIAALDAAVRAKASADAADVSEAAALSSANASAASAATSTQQAVRAETARDASEAFAIDSFNWSTKSAEYQVIASAAAVQTANDAAQVAEAYAYIHPAYEDFKVKYPQVVQDAIDARAAAIAAQASAGSADESEASAIDARDASEAFAIDALAARLETDEDRIAAQQAAIDAGNAAQVKVDAFKTELAGPTGGEALGFLGTTIHAALMANRCLPAEVLAAKYNLPLINIGAVINKAWDDGIGVALGAKRYINNTDILVRADSVLIGAGSGITTIKSANGFAGNVIDTKNFAALKAAQPVSANDPTNPVPKKYVLQGFAVDGNVLNYGGVVSATNGFGMRLYGGGYSIIDVQLARIPGVGFYSELAYTGTYYNSDPQEPKAFSPIDEYGGVGIRGLYIFDTGEEGFVFVGPADIQVRDVYVGWPAGSQRNNYVAGKTSKLFPGRSVDGALILRSCELGFLHSYDNRFGYGVYVDRFAAGHPAVRFNAESVMSENNFGNFFFGANMRYQIGTMDSHNNTGGDGTRAHFDIQASFGGTCENIRVKKEAGYLSEYGCDVARVTGTKQKLKFNIETTTGQTTGKGIICSAPLSDIEVVAAALDGPVAEVTSAFTSSKLKVQAQLCATGINFASAPGSGDYASEFELVSDRCTNPLSGFSGLTRQQTNYIKVSHTTGSGASKRNKTTAQTPVNVSSTLVQSLDIAHNLVAAPPIQNCQPYVTAIVGNTYTMPAVEKLHVVSTSATVITVEVKFGTGGVGQVALCVEAGI